jgi:hypothetical protein
MTYVRVVDPLLNSGKPGRSTDAKRLRDNQDDFDARLQVLEALSIITTQDIRDHFVATTIDTTNWTQVTGGSGTIALTGEHTLRLSSIGSGSTHKAYVHGTTSRLVIDKTEEYIAFMEARVKRVGNDFNSYIFGWNDTAVLDPIDTTDFVGVIREPGGNWSTKTSITAGSANTAAYSTATNWNVIQLRFTCSATAGNRKVETYLNGSLFATLSDETKMPTATLVPVIGVSSGGGGSVQLDCDYIEYGFMTKPLAA